MHITRNLGQEIENPQHTFTLVENEFKMKIDLLSYKLYHNAKDLEREKQSNSDMKMMIIKDCKYLGESHYYAIKQHLNNLYQQIENEKRYCSNLQSELNQLKNYNENLMNIVHLMNKKLDNLENIMGIQLKSKKVRFSKNY